MSKSYYSLGLMSGTSMDGVDASVIQTDGKFNYRAILDKYFEYPQVIYKQLTKLRDKIKSSKDLKKFSKEIKNIEKEITLFHAKAVNQILKKTKANVNFIGFHGQTIYHNAKERISKQLGDGRLLSKITKKTVICDFRQNDLKNGGHGAPLAPIFHKVLSEKFNLSKKNTAIFVNIGGISNLTRLTSFYTIYSKDCGPGMCLIDKWIRTKSKNKIDKDGKIAKKGSIDHKILKKYINQIDYVRKDAGINSFDVNDFKLFLVKKMSLEDGAATLTEFSAKNILMQVDFISDFATEKINLILCGGGRKNKFLVGRMKKLIKELFNAEEHIKLTMIDDLGIDGDFVESQAFAYLAVRSYIKLPISFPETTGCKKPITGGKIIKFK